MITLPQEIFDVQIQYEFNMGARWKFPNLLWMLLPRAAQWKWKLCLECKRNFYFSIFFSFLLLDIQTIPPWFVCVPSSVFMKLFWSIQEKNIVKYCFFSSIFSSSVFRITVVWLKRILLVNWAFSVLIIVLLI